MKVLQDQSVRRTGSHPAIQSFESEGPAGAYRIPEATVTAYKNWRRQ